MTRIASMKIVVPLKWTDGDRVQPDLRVDEIMREEGEFPIPELDYHNRYFRCSLNNVVFLYLHIQLHPPGAVFHLTHKAWSHNALRAMRSGMESIVKPMLRDEGAEYMIGITDGTVKNWAKLMRALGFEPQTAPDGQQAVIARV